MKSTQGEIVRDILYCLSTNNQCGLHIVIDDGNLDDDDIQWCKENLNNNCDFQDMKRAKRIIKYISNCTVKERYTIYNKAWNEYE